MFARLLPLFLLAACERPDPIEDHVTDVQIANTTFDGLHVVIHLDDETCRDVSSFEGSRLGDLEPGYLTDEAALEDGRDHLLLEDPTGFLTEDACSGVVSIGFPDAASLEDEEAVVLVLFGDNTSYDITLSGNPLGSFEMEPESPLSAANLWGTTRTFTIDGPYEVPETASVGLYWDSFDSEELGGTTSADTITIAFPVENPRPDLGDPDAVWFDDVVVFPDPDVAAQDGSDVGFGVEVTTHLLDVVSIDP